MKRVYILSSVILIISLVFACAEGHLSEEEYTAKAKDYISQGSIEEAINVYKGLVADYPESEMIAEYKSALLDLTIKAAVEFGSTRKGEVYSAEALLLSGSFSDTLIHWINYQKAQRLINEDPQKAQTVLMDITPEGYHYIAQMLLGNNDYRGANSAYERLLKQYPDDPNNYKALFLIGFNYSEYLKDYDKAKLYFERVIEEFPQCDLARDAKWMIENLGKSLEEIDFFIEETAQAD